MFFYNVNMLPSELFDESISLRVGSQLFFPPYDKSIIHDFISKWPDCDVGFFFLAGL